MNLPPASAALLTQTSLQLDGAITESVAAHLASTLRRVPGVLLAEVDAAAGRIAVAHDEAVKMQSLLAGIESAGCHATPDAPKNSSLGDISAAATQQDALRTRRLATIAFLAFAAVALLAGFVPEFAYKQWLLPALMLLVWSLYAASMQLRRPPP
ncbi:MAG: hypothetical protein ACLPYS_09100 [Vulcanimicrobiaceae bacterium]